MTAALSEAQQQRQDVDGARRLLGLLGTRRSSVSLGHTKLLGNWGGKTNRVSIHTPISFNNTDCKPGLIKRRRISIKTKDKKRSFVSAAVRCGLDRKHLSAFNHVSNAIL